MCLTVFSLSSDTDSAATAGVSSVVGLRMTMTVVPVVGLLIALIYFYRHYILTDKKMAELSETLKK